MLDLQIGPRLFGRSLWFTDDLFQQLRPYDLTIAPAVAASVEWYPAVPYTSGPASWFGVVARGEYGLGLTSGDAQGRSYATTSYALSVGGRARWRVWRAELAFTLAYDRREFSIDRQSVTQAQPEGIPNVTYESVRLGLSARVQIIPRIAVRASGAFLVVASAGEIDSDRYFPRSFVGGVETTLGGAYELFRGFEVRLDLDWLRYFHSMNPVPGDRLVAGGAADDFYGATVSAAYRR
jgi:hypothetical protein